MNRRQTGFVAMFALAGSSCSDAPPDLEPLRQSAAQAQQSCDDAKAYLKIYPDREALKESAANLCSLAQTVGQALRDSEKRVVQND